MEQTPSHQSSSHQHEKLVEAIVALIVVQQTQPLHQTIWPCVFIMKIVERPLVQRIVLVTPTQPIVEATLICAYC